ncbi:hypothetical protein [Clostridium sardiniense]|uniref:hypothetical protein n=1 Tax=Clostridium sardiniense TaxID=29369 RepID=UPI003D353EB8
MNKSINFLNLSLLLVGIVASVLNKESIYVALFLINIIFYMLSNIDDITFLLYSFLIPSKALQFLAVLIVILILLIKKNKVSYYKRTNIIIIFLIYILIQSLFDVLIHEGSFLALILEFSIYSIYFVCIYLIINKASLINYKLIKNLEIIVVVEAIIGITQFIISKQFGDSIRGSFISAHYYGIFLALWIFYYTKYLINDTQKANKIHVIFNYMLVIIMFVMNDAKHVYAIFIVALIIYYFIKKVSKKNVVVISGVFILLIIILGVNVFKINSVQNKLNKEIPDVSQYVYNPRYNQKYIFFDRTFNTLEGYKFFIGEGLGQYSSQASNYIAYNGFYHEDIGERDKYFKSFISKDYRYNIQDLMIGSYMRNIHNTSFVLSFPLQSFISIFAEIGFIGFIFMLLVFKSYIKDYEDSIIIIFFIIISIFDIYFEVPSVFMMMNLFILLPYKYNIRNERQ